MLILGVDPGTVQSAYCLYDSDAKIPITFAKEDNQTLIKSTFSTLPRAEHVVFEMVACYGMPVGKSVFETCVWLGRFQQLFESANISTSFLYRKHDICMNLCKTSRAKDTNIRQALLDRWGGKEIAVGKKKTPGPLYGVANDVWSALAIVVTYVDLKLNAPVVSPTVV